MPVHQNLWSLWSKARSLLNPSHLSPRILKKFPPAIRTLFRLHYQLSHLPGIILISIQRTISLVYYKNLNTLLSATPVFYPLHSKISWKICLYSLPLFPHLPFASSSCSSRLSAIIHWVCTLRSTVIHMLSHPAVTFLFSSLYPTQEHQTILSCKLSLFLNLRYFTLLNFPPVLPGHSFAAPLFSDRTIYWKTSEFESGAPSLLYLHPLTGWFHYISSDSEVYISGLELYL